MAESYAECCKSLPHLGGRSDGCQKFAAQKLDSEICSACGCHRTFHTPPVQYKTEVVYTKCHKIHDFKFQSSVDGCQEFVAAGAALTCDGCGCHKSFHRNEITRKVTSTD